MGTKNNPGQFDCYAKAEPDEPMFVLLGRDRHAPTLVWLWAVLRELDQEQPDIVEEARTCVTEMLLWQRAHDRSAAGLAQSTLAGVFELIRAANFRGAEAVKPENNATSFEVVRGFLAQTKFESDSSEGSL